MKTYMPLNGLRWSRNSGSANCDMPQSAVFGRPGGGKRGAAKVLLRLFLLMAFFGLRRLLPVSFLFRKSSSSDARLCLYMLGHITDIQYLYGVIINQ